MAGRPQTLGFDPKDYVASNLRRSVCFCGSTPTNDRTCPVCKKYKRFMLRYCIVCKDQFIVWAEPFTVRTCYPCTPNKDAYEVYDEELIKSKIVRSLSEILKDRNDT